jgi:hypothetical protein
MKNVVEKIEKNGSNIIKDNNFLFEAFENRLVTRLKIIFEKYKIPINQKLLKKNLEENLINNFYDINSEVVTRYVKLIGNYEKVVQKYVSDNIETSVIKKATMKFIDEISKKNKDSVNKNISINFIEYINSIIYVYDNHSLNTEIINRINDDIREIVNEFNRNNYNFVIESINLVIKNIIDNM